MILLFIKSISRSVGTMLFVHKNTNLLLFISPLLWMKSLMCGTVTITRLVRWYCNLMISMFWYLCNATCLCPDTFQLALKKYLFILTHFSSPIWLHFTWASKFDYCLFLLLIADFFLKKKNNGNFRQKFPKTGLVRLFVHMGPAIRNAYPVPIRSNFWT